MLPDFMAQSTYTCWISSSNNFREEPSMLKGQFEGLVPDNSTAELLINPAEATDRHCDDDDCKG